MVTLKMGYSLVQEEENNEATQQVVYKCLSWGGHAVICMPKPTRGLGRLRRPQGELGEQCLHVAKKDSTTTWLFGVGNNGQPLFDIWCLYQMVWSVNGQTSIYFHL